MFGKDKKDKQSGFSLAEVLLAVSVLTLVLGGVTSIAVGTLKASSYGKQYVEAQGVAQRQLECLRKKREEDYWMGDKDWGSLFTSTVLNRKYHTDNCQIDFSAPDYFNKGNGSFVNNTDYEYWLEFEKVQTNFDNSSNGDYEKILRVNSIVQWSHRGDDHEVKFSTYLSDWMMEGYDG